MNQNDWMKMCHLSLIDLNSGHIATQNTSSFNIMKANYFGDYIMNNPGIVQTYLLGFLAFVIKKKLQVFKP